MHEYVLDPEHWPAMPPLHRAFLEYAIPLFRTDTRLAGLATGGSFVSGGLDAHSDLDLVVVSLPEASQDVLDAVASAGGRVCFVNLTCPIAELERRIVQPSRAECGKLQSLDLFRELHATGVFEYPPLPDSGLSIDTSQTSPREVAVRIREFFSLERKACQAQDNATSFYVRATHAAGSSAAFPCAALAPPALPQPSRTFPRAVASGTIRVSCSSVNRLRCIRPPVAMSSKPHSATGGIIRGQVASTCTDNVLGTCVISGVRQ